MNNQRKDIYCYTGDDIQSFCHLLQMLKQNHRNLLPLREMLRNNHEQSGQENLCTVIVKSGNEEFLSQLPDVCRRENVSVAIFLQSLVSDLCISRLRTEDRTPLFATLGLLYRYPASYLQNRVRMQVALADIPVDQDHLSILRENRVRVVLSSHHVPLTGILTYRTTELNPPSGKPISPTVSLPVSQPIITFGADTPYLAIRTEGVPPGSWKRKYDSADGVYALTSDLAEQYTETLAESRPSVERLTDALARGLYPLITLNVQKAPLLVYAWSTATFCAYTVHSLGAWTAMSISESVLFQGMTSCTYLKPLPVNDENNCEAFLRDLYQNGTKDSQAFLHDLYRREDTNKTELLSLGTFLQERKLVCSFLLEEATRKSLFLPDVEEHVLLLEKFVSPSLQLLENGEDPFRHQSRLLIADGISKILLSEENCIEAYLEELERCKRDADWLKLLRKKAEKT